MAEGEYLDYVHRMMEGAEHLLTNEDDPDPCGAMGVCFDVLVLFPEHQEAKNFIQRAYQDRNLIRHNHRVLSGLIDEWDDRP